MSEAYAFAIDEAREWLIASDKVMNGIEKETKRRWFEGASDEHIIGMMDITYPGKWSKFSERALKEFVRPF